MFDFLADPEVLNTILMILGLILTFIINRAAGAFTAFTGIQIEARRPALRDQNLRRKQPEARARCRHRLSEGQHAGLPQAQYSRRAGCIGAR